MGTTQPNYEIYFDLKCHLCYADARWLMKQPFADQFKIINFQAGEQGSQNIPASELIKELHAVDLFSRQTYRGINAVILVLSFSKNWAWAAWLLKVPVIYPLAWIIYKTFAKIRNWLPRRKDCSL